MRRLAAIVLWSVVAAAFIGPGTVATAAAAGATHGLALLWALAFSTFATLVLQEASARLTVVSGRDLAQALGERARGARGVALVVLVLAAIVVGCAAYEAGNILGGVAGAALAIDLPRPVLTLLLGAVAAALLWVGNPKTVARLLSATVAVMGIGFLCAACGLAPAPSAVLAGTFVPRLPTGSGLLVLGLVGTTVVPYNLFLGSGVAEGQRLDELRFGLTVAVVLGGLISMGVLVVGTALVGELTFPALSVVLAARLGPWAATLFACGLFAAGLSSAVTAPLAAAITARGLAIGAGRGAPRPSATTTGPATGRDPWWPRGWRFRAVWAGVLAAGLVFGLADVRPVPVILLAQAANGVLLPWVAIFLLLAINDRRLMGVAGLNGPLANAAAGLVVAVTLVLGTRGVLAAATAALGRPPLPELPLLAVSALLGALLLIPLLRALHRRRIDQP